MKKNLLIFIGVVFMCLLMTTSVSAEEYIVKLSSISLYDDANHIHMQRNYHIAHDESELQEYIDNDMVEYYEPNYDVELFGVPKDESYTLQWYHSILHTQTSWDLETYGNDIRVAVIDSGCYRHNDISRNLVGGYNYIENSEDIHDSIGHGTAVSGIIAAEMNEIGIVGIANKANIIALKCFDSETTTKVSTIVDAIYDAVDKYDCQVINMSWGLKNNSQSLYEAVEYAAQHNVIIIAAVGNGGSDMLAYPAAYNEVIGVGSVDREENHSDFSRYNQSVFVVAPGENIMTLDAHNAYVEQSGTSYSAPMLTGLTAIMLSINENMTCDDLKNCLVYSSKDLGNEGYDEYYGYGLIDIENAISYMLKDFDGYVSPIYNNNEKIYFYVFNNSNHLLKAVMIYADYYDGVLNESITTELEIETNECMEVPIIQQLHSYEFKCMLWDSMNNMRPISYTRIKNPL